MCGFVRTTAAAILLVSLAYSQPQEDDDCLVHKEGWKCKDLKACPWAQDTLDKGLQPELCGLIGKRAMVCCPVKEGNPTPAPGGKRVSQIKCEKYAGLVKAEGSPMESGQCGRRRQKRVYGGRETRSSEFPHMASIGYGDNRNFIAWRCGGSLISEKFVLSAASCSFKSGERAKWVWLGTDTESRIEYKQRTLRIARSILHPLYNPDTRYNDIGLYELAETVDFNEYMRPACLPDHRPIPTSLTATGWGMTTWDGDNTSILRKVDLSPVDPAECQKAFGTNDVLPDGFKNESQICAGGNRQDTCLGDNGGPLQLRLEEQQCAYMQVGITSFGMACGLVRTPGIYTRVGHYLPWIESVVWKDEL